MWQAEPPSHPCSVPQWSPQNRSFHCTSNPMGLRQHSLGFLHQGQLTLFPLAGSRASHGACHRCPCSPVATRSPRSLLAKRQPWHRVGHLLHLHRGVPRGGAGGHIGAEPAPGPAHPGAERSLERSLWVCRGGSAPLSIAPRALGVSLSPPSPLVLALGPARPQPPSLPPLTCALRPRLMKAQMGL